MSSEPHENQTQSLTTSCMAETSCRHSPLIFISSHFTPTLRVMWLTHLQNLQNVFRPASKMHFRKGHWISKPLDSNASYRTNRILAGSKKMWCEINYVETQGSDAQGENKRDMNLMSPPMWIFGVASISRQFDSKCNYEAHITKIEGTFEEYCLLSKVSTLNGNRRRKAGPHLISPHSAHMGDSNIWFTQLPALWFGGR